MGIREQSMGWCGVAASDRLSVLLRSGNCWEVACPVAFGAWRLSCLKGAMQGCRQTRSPWFIQGISSVLSPVRVNLMENFLFSIVTMGIPWEIFESVTHIGVISLLNYTRWEKAGRQEETKILLSKHHQVTFLFSLSPTYDYNIKNFISPKWEIWFLGYL